MCLCERTPRELAPPGSYIQWEEVRRRVVEAHHVDLKSAGGARHAGNLILLVSCIMTITAVGLRAPPSPKRFSAMPWRRSSASRRRATP